MNMMMCDPATSASRDRLHAGARSIVVLVNALGYGGAEVQVSRLAVGMQRRGWSVAVVSMVPPVALWQELEANGIEVECLNMRRGVPNPMAIVRLRQFLARRRPHVLHSHMVHANLLARATRMLSRVPVVVCTAHSIKECGRFLELGYRYTDRLADLTTNVSQAGVDRYVQIGAVPAGRIRFVPNGLDLSRFSPDPAERERLRRELQISDRFVWLAVGRFTPAKDYPNMLRGFAALPDPRALLLLVGRGELEQDARDLAASLGLNDRVRFLGVRDDIPALMNCADGYVLSSAWEGMPLVLQEASATGVPIVATDVGGNREVVLDQKSGVLVPPGDPPALARAMARVMSLSPDERQRFGQRGREHVGSRYNLDRVLDQWQAIYEELIQVKSLHLM